MKDRRYFALKTYIDSGELKAFTEIFDIVPRSVIIRDTGINYTRLTNKLKAPEKFTVKDIILISRLIRVDSFKIFNLIHSAVDRKTVRLRS